MDPGFNLIAEDMQRIVAKSAATHNNNIYYFYLDN